MVGFDIKNELTNLTKSIKWNFRGILDTSERLHEIPKNLNFQSLFEAIVLERLEGFKSKPYKKL